MKSEILERDSSSLRATQLPVGESALSFLWRVVLATLLAWFVSQVLCHVLIGEPLVAPSPVAEVGGVEYVGMTFISLLLVTASLAYVASLSSLRGVALVQALALAHFGLHHLLAIVEATVFLSDMSAREVGLGMLAGALQSMLLAVFVAAVLGKLNPATDRNVESVLAEPMSSWEWVWKFGLCSIVYVFLYIAAGMLIFPLVRKYYPELADMPIDPVFLLGLQIQRGIFYAACLVPLVRSLRASRTRIALSIAVLVPVVHGIAGLLVPNEHMGPVAWRLAHMVEIGWSNFAYGLLIGYLFSRGIPQGEQRREDSAVPSQSTN